MPESCVSFCDVGRVTVIDSEGVSEKGSGRARLCLLRACTAVCRAVPTKYDGAIAVLLLSYYFVRCDVSRERPPFAGLSTIRRSQQGSRWRARRIDV